jgi:transposase InsO family protein
VPFRYRLEGHDPEWQAAGLRRQAFYTDLKPGHCTFRVVASNDDGVWNTQGAIEQRQTPLGLIVHSDRGSQNASALHQALLARHGLVGSMSRKGNCRDTRSTIGPSAASGLTRPGIGGMPLR